MVCLEPASDITFVYFVILLASYWFVPAEMADNIKGEPKKIFRKTFLSMFFMDTVMFFVIGINNLEQFVLLLSLLHIFVFVLLNSVSMCISNQEEEEVEEIEKPLLV